MHGATVKICRLVCLIARCST